MKIYWILFGISGFLAVGLGAFGAHGLKNILTDKYLEIFHTGVKYQFYHTLALGLVLLMYQYQASPILTKAALFFVLGIIIFSGSLYILALTKIGFLGAITPIGGVCFLIGWGFLVWFGIQLKT